MGEAPAMNGCANLRPKYEVVVSMTIAGALLVPALGAVRALPIGRICRGAARKGGEIPAEV
jgi:hypothetical protein